MSAPAPLLVPALFVVIWATGFVAARFVSPHAEAFTFVAVRVVAVALVLVRRQPVAPAGGRPHLEAEER